MRRALSQADSIARFGVDIDATLEWSVDVAPSVAPLSAAGATATWDLLAATAHRDVAAARMLEPHIDARNILDQAGIPARELGGDRASWGVFAAEGPGMRLAAEPASFERAGTPGEAWTLTGTKPWCSLATNLSHALVTAHVEGGRRLFAVDLRSPGVRPHPGPWLARGLPHVVSTPVDFDRVPATPVGGTGWYLDRPGFAWGGMSVAACWWGAAVGLADAVYRAAESERADQVAAVHAGEVDGALWAARAALREAAEQIDAARTLDAAVTPDDRADGERLRAARVRWVVARAAETTLAAADAALGPAPLVADEEHARRVADLHLYLRQHHGLRDAARLGRLRGGGR